MRDRGPCAVVGCGRKVRTLGFCHAHYERQRRGDPVGGPIADTPVKRFFAKVTVDPSGCWIWTAATCAKGRYGRTNADGVSEQAHHFTYRLAFGPVPDGLELDHLCRVTLCVHPLHLEAVTHRENLRRGQGQPARNLRKTHCKRGHVFTPENTLRTSQGHRYCAACQVERRPIRAAQQRARRARQVAAAAEFKAAA